MNKHVPFPGFFFFAELFLPESFAGSFAYVPVLSRFLASASAFLEIFGQKQKKKTGIVEVHTLNIENYADM